MKKLLHDPLVHFLFAGFVIFIILGQLSPAENVERIFVDRASLLTFVQYRSRAFEPAAAEALFSSISADDQQRLIDEYIQEEALYREAAKLGLGDGDYVIRRRMVQKLEFMAEAAIGERSFSEEELRAYYDTRQTDYAVPASLTFSHVFLSREKRNAGALTAEAQHLLDQLHSTDALFEDATRNGDRFLFHTNYVERTPEYITSHFGSEMAPALLSSDIPLNRWSGPFHSDYGLHLVFLTHRKAASIAPFTDVKTRVEDDLRRQAAKKERRRIISEIVQSYDPLISDDLKSASDDRP